MGHTDDDLASVRGHDVPMSEDDDIEKLLREVEAVTNSKPNATIGEPVAGSEVAKPTTKDLAASGSSGPGGATIALIAGGIGGLLVMLLFGILPLINVGSISTIAAGAVGGVCGYGVVRLSKRGGRGDKS